MDAETLDLLRTSLRHVLTEPDGRPFGTRLGELGWDEVVADDEAAATSMLFEEKGRSLAGVDALDLVMAREIPGSLGVPADQGVLVLPAGLRPRLCSSRVVDDRLVLDGIALRPPDSGDHLVVPIGDPRPEGLAVVAAEYAERLTIEALDGIDPALGLVSIRGEVPAGATTMARSGADAWWAMVAAGRRALATELLGVASRAIEIAVGHAKDRRQFGAPIGSFQAVQHLLADAYAPVVAARAVAEEAWSSRDPHTAAAAKALAGAAAEGAADAGLQVLGAIGFTWEHPFHRYQRRILALDALLGSHRQLTREIGMLLIETGRVPRVGVL